MAGLGVRVGRFRWRIRLGFVRSAGSFLLTWILMLPLFNFHGRLFAAEKVTFDVSASLEPSLPWLTYHNDLDAKAAPETHIVIVSLLAQLEFLLDLFQVRNVVLFRKVNFKVLPVVVDLPTCFCRVRLEMVALPSVELPVLLHLVPHPVIFAARSHFAPGERATVWLRVPPEMFSSMQRQQDRGLNDHNRMVPT